MALTITLNQPTINIGDQLAKLIETIKEVNGYDGKDIIFDFNNKERKEERGYGIRTSRRMIVDGLKGQFILISGKAMLFNDKLTELPVRWNGTILTLRISSNVETFNYINYV
ncbi:MAG: hypothetical protein IIA88_03595 [Bacteroidetes bacterium]|nr:hypothetical protein [Bacteroidota bacterium]